MISDKTDSSSDKNTKKAKNKVLGHLLSLFFGILLGGLLCLLLVVAARHMGLISFGEADSFYDTAVSYYSEQFGDAASAQSQDPASFARFGMRMVKRMPSSVSSRCMSASTPARCINPSEWRMVFKKMRTSLTM